MKIFNEYSKSEDITDELGERGSGFAVFPKLTKASFENFRRTLDLDHRILTLSVNVSNKGWVYYLYNSNKIDYKFVESLIRLNQDKL